MMSSSTEDLAIGLHKLSETLKAEEIIWKQKSRVI